MNTFRHLRTCVLLCGLLVILQPAQGRARQEPDAAKSSPRSTSTKRDGQHDFDFEIGTWKTHLRRRQHPLSGSTTWLEYEGTTVVRKVWNGRANMVELEVDGPAGHIEALSLRLYNPEARQWSLNFSNSAGGTMAQPTIGEFKNGRGEFIDQESLNGRAILVRFVISDITPTSCHFEQSFSDDGGKTWEVNWIATDTRVGDAPPAAAAPARDDSLSGWTKDAYGMVKKILLRSAEKMPAADYAFKPTDETRSFGQVVGHLADAQYTFCSIVRGEKAPAPRVEQTKSAKADLIAALEDGFVYCDKAYAGMTDASAAQMIDLFGARTPRLSVLTSNNMHNLEHYGNLVTYMRLKKIVPPTSEPGFTAGAVVGAISRTSP
jgi:uncharacterized damage-inducible protein DinB